MKEFFNDIRMIFVISCVLSIVLFPMALYSLESLSILAFVPAPFVAVRLFGYKSHEAILMKMLFVLASVLIGGFAIDVLQLSRHFLWCYFLCGLLLDLVVVIVYENA